VETFLITALAILAAVTPASAAGADNPVAEFQAEVARLGAAYAGCKPIIYVVVGIGTLNEWKRFNCPADHVNVSVDGAHRTETWVYRWITPDGRCLPQYLDFSDGMLTSVSGHEGFKVLRPSRQPE
jgi:hypothetical protein